MSDDARGRRVRVIVVGAGYVATHHLAALRSLDFVDIVAICDPNEEAAQAQARRFGVPATFACLADTADLAADAVHVLTPPASHFGIAREALEAGRHVLVEKPLADRAEDCEALVRIARARGLLLGVNHSDLLDPVVSQAIRAIRQGRIGDVRSVTIVRNSDYPAHGGGPLPQMLLQGSYPLRDLGVHGLYTIEAILGPLRQVRAAFQASPQPAGLPFGEWQVDALAGDGIGRLQLSWTARPMENTLVVRGTRGSIHVDRFLQTCRIQRLLPGPKFVGIVAGGWLQAVADVARIPRTLLRVALRRLEPSPGIRAGARAFAQAVRQGSAPPFDGEDAHRIAKVMDALCADPDAQADRQRRIRLQPLPDADVLVTGGTGFLGRPLVARLLQRGMRVRVLARSPAACDGLGVQCVVGDLGDAQMVDHAIRGVRTVYHLGAGMRGSAAEFDRGTVWGTRNVVDACLRHGVQRLVHVSSLGILDHAGRKRGEVVDEAYRLDPQPDRRGHYTRCKQEAERIVRAAIDERGLRAVILRPGQIFGPGAGHVPPNGVIGIAGRWLAVGNLRHPLPLVYRDDVVDAVLLAGTSAAADGGIFHIVDGHQPTQREYLAACRSSRPPLLRVPRWLMRLVAGAIEAVGARLGREMPLTRYKVDSLRPLAGLDGRLAREVLGWTPGVGTERGLAITFGCGPSPSPAQDGRPSLHADGITRRG